MNYDVVLIHPPAIHDFRKKAISYGPIALTVPESTRQFIVPPVGMLSIADYLDRNGYRVIVDNIGERMLTNEHFDTEEHISSLSANIFAIGLHWCVHSQGAIEISKLCKKLHPEATVIIGGLTATVFAEEIVQRYEFIDAVIRGEAEKPFLQLIQGLNRRDTLTKVPNLTFRDDEGNIKSNLLMPTDTKLDEFEFTRLDLIEPKAAIFPLNKPSHWSIPVCRGCLNNCVTCGGSRYSYKTHFGRLCPAFRSPEKIAEDIQKLNSQGVEQVFLFQDPRMGGNQYWRELLKTLQKENIKLRQLTMELWDPADDEYIREISKIGIPIVLTISPESCVESVRRAHGRNYSNAELFRTIKLCKKYGISLATFTMIALAKDTPDTIRKNWEVWEEICNLNQKLNNKTSALYSFGPMILLDPGSHAFDYPSSYGYKLIFNNLEDYVKGMSHPSWHQWVSYETELLKKDMIIKLTNKSIFNSISLMERYGVCSSADADKMRQQLLMDELFQNTVHSLNNKVGQDI